MDTLLLLPNQLFEYKYIPKHVKNIFVYTHPHYFSAYRYNKKKLLLHHASLDYYKDYVGKKYNILPMIPKQYVMFDSADNLKMLSLKPLELYDNPNFLLTREDYKSYQNKTKSFKFHPFYMHFKKQLNYLPNEKSHDKENRSGLPKNIKVPKISSNQSDKKWVTPNINLVNDKYKDNYGNTNDFIFPISHKSAKRWLKHFLQLKLDNFGKYQDAIDKDNPYLFHSLLAPALNIGLINPKEILDDLLTTDTAMNNKEGFLRQIFWREYQLYCYRYFDFNQSYFNNQNKLTKDWYYGTLNVLPVDEAIKRAFASGYLHHIERLMIIGNFMNLSGINEKEGFRWFMEFSCDSYEWVMHQNVLEMVFCISGGKTTRRPYVSSSNYVKKMSNYPRGDWEQVWDHKYEEFKTKQKLYKFRYFF